MEKKPLIGLLGALVAAVTVEFNDQVVSAALPDIEGALGISSDPGTWLTSLYASGQVIGMALSTSLALAFSARRFGFFAFALCALATAVTPCFSNLALLFSLRFLQGLSGGFIIPLLLTVGIRVLTPETRLYALAAYALTATFAPNISVTLAALWDDVVSWRFVFWEDIPLFAMAGVLAWYGLPHDEPDRTRLKKFDWPGALLIIVAAFAFISLLEQGNRLDWFNSKLICVLALISAIAIPLFIVNEMRRQPPLFGLWLLKRRNFTYAFVALFSFVIVSQSASSLPIRYLQQIQGFRPLQIYPATLLVAAIELPLLPIMAVLLNRAWVDARVVSLLGLACIVAGDWGDASLTSVWVSRDILFWQGLQAVGQPLFIMPLLMMATNTIRDPADAPYASAMVNSTRAMAEPVGLWLTQLITRWRGALHSDRITDQIGQTRYSTIQAVGLIQGSPPPLLPSGAPRTPGALAALNAAVRAQVTVMTLADAFLIFGVLTAILMLIVLVLPERTYPPRIVLAKD